MSACNTPQWQGCVQFSSGGDGVEKGGGVLDGGVVVTGRDGDVDEMGGALVADVQKAEKILGFSAKTPLQEGLKKTVQWYLRL